MSEDPIQHLKDFLIIVDSIYLNGATRNTTRLHLFHFSLHDQAINWLDRLLAGSISTWDDLTTRFLTQFFPPERTAKLQNDILMFPQHQDELSTMHGIMAIDYAAGGRLRKLRAEVAWATIENLAQYEGEGWNDPIFPNKGSPDYIDANLGQELESMECRVETLMRNEVLLYYVGGFTFPKRHYQEEFDQEDQIRQLEEDIRKTKDTFMFLVDSLIATLKVKIEAQQAHSIKFKKITTFPTRIPTITSEILKPSMVHMVSMISNIKPTIYRYPHQYLNSNLKMPILHSFKETKLVYKDEDEVEIKMMGIKIDKEF
ncbi:zinc finger, CCHC-type containing protein [Tanacetum coccineum]